MYLRYIYVLKAYITYKINKWFLPGNNVIVLGFYRSFKHLK